MPSTGRGRRGREERTEAKFHNPHSRKSVAQSRNIPPRKPRPRPRPHHAFLPPAGLLPGTEPAPGVHERLPDGPAQAPGDRRGEPHQGGLGTAQPPPWDRAQGRPSAPGEGSGWPLASVSLETDCPRCSERPQRPHFPSEGLRPGDVRIATSVTPGPRGDHPGCLLHQRHLPYVRPGSSR